MSRVGSRPVSIMIDAPNAPNNTTRKGHGIYGSIPLDKDPLYSVPLGARAWLQDTYVQYVRGRRVITKTVPKIIYWAFSFVFLFNRPLLFANDANKQMPMPVFFNQCFRDWEWKLLDLRYVLDESSITLVEEWFAEETFRNLCTVRVHERAESACFFHSVMGISLQSFSQR